MLGGAREIRIHGQDVPVRAEVAALSSLSAHADANEIVQWLGSFRQVPARRTGRGRHPAPAHRAWLRWTVHVPEHPQAFELD